MFFIVESFIKHKRTQVGYLENKTKPYFYLFVLFIDIVYILYYILMF